LRKTSRTLRLKFETIFGNRKVREVYAKNTQSCIGSNLILSYPI